MIALFQVESVSTLKRDLVAAYAGEQLIEVEQREDSVLKAWKELLALVQKRAALLSDALNKFRFFNMYRDLMTWMEGAERQMNLHEKPRFVFEYDVALSRDRDL